MDVIFWEPEVIRHLSDTWIAFQSLSNQPLLVMVGRPLISIRKKQGWKKDNIADLQHIMLSQKQWWQHGKSIIDNNPKAVHVFVGFWTIKKFFPLMLYAAWRGMKVAVLQEPYSTSFTGFLKEDPFIISWTKAKLRPILYRFFALSLKLMSRSKPPCILAISSLARDQFIRVGFGEKTIFPFGYFENKVFLKKVLKEKDPEILRLIFVGALLKRKGIDLLIESVEKISHNGRKITLDIYGAGQTDKFILHASDCVNYKGVLSQDDVQEVISKYDYLVLPSRHDGWGVVVNEALLQGVPVVVSDRVGAKCIVETTGAGFVFKSEDGNDLTNTLEKLVLTPNIIHELRKQAENVGKLILPEVAASYLRDVFIYYFQENKSHKPEAIWCGGETAKRISSKDYFTDQKYNENKIVH